MVKILLKKNRVIRIGDTVVSLDVIERYFCCDLDDCKGACCIEGDAGAPITQEEEIAIKEALPAVIDNLPKEAVEVIDKQGVSYIDEEGDLVTSIIGNKDCVFCTYDNKGVCLCALEIGYNSGKCNFKKPVSCHLYPVRLTQYPTFTAVNYDERSICKGAVKLGTEKGIRVYQFLEGSLTRFFGKEWYDELKLVAEEYLRQKGENI